MFAIYSVNILTSAYSLVASLIAMN